MAQGPAPVQEPGAPVPADGPLVSPSVSSSSFSPGQQVVLSYQIVGAQGVVDEFPQTIEVAGLSIVYNGQTQRVSLNNGVRRVEIGIRYTVQSSEPGVYEIPPQSFSVGGTALEAAAVRVTVTEGPEVNDELLPTVQLTLGKTEFWKGEVIPVGVTILVHPAVQPLSQFFPQVKTPNFAVNRFDRSAGLEAREVNGQIWRAWQMESVLTALQAGAHEVGPAEIKAELLIPDPSSIGDPFGRQQGNRRSLTLTSNTVPVNVKELPLEGRPPDFSGTVGDFEIETEASPVTLKAGDPIAVEIAIHGAGNFDAITPPAMENPDGWRLYEARVSQENRSWGTEPGQIRFTQILIPEKLHTEIPAFVLHYFDPARGSYVTKRTQPIALTVTGEFKPAGEATMGARDFSGPVDATAPTEELGDILDQPLPAGRWVMVTAAAAPTHPWLLHGVPAAFLLLLLGGGVRRRLRAAAAARQPAPGTPRELWQILADLRRGTPGRREFHALVNEYLQAAPWHLKRPPAPGPALQEIATARDRWLYGPEDDAARQPVSDEERRRSLEILSQL